MAIIIGADGGKLGGPLKALEAAGEALATNHQLQTQARQEDRQNRLDTQGLAEAQQVMRLRDADEIRRNRELTLREAENKRQEADATYTAKMRGQAENERIAAKTGAAARLKAMLGGDHTNDPEFIGPDIPHDEQRAIKLGIPIETLREYDVLAQNAADMSPEEYQRAAADIASRAQGLIYSRRKQNVLGLLGSLSAPTMSADGTQQGDPIIDKKRAQELQQALEQGASPDQVEHILASTLKSHSQRQAATQVNTIRTQGLGQYLMDIQAAGMNPQMPGQSTVDPENLADALAIQKQMEALASLSTPSEIAAMDREARRAVTGGRGTGSGSKDQSYKNKPRAQWDAHDWYDRDVANAKELGYTGSAAEAYVERSRQWREKNGAGAQSPAADPSLPMGPQGGAQPPMQYTVDPNAPMPQAHAEPSQSAAPSQSAPAAAQAATEVTNPYSSEGTPAVRVQTAAQQIFAARQAGEMFTEDEIKGMLKAARDGTPAPERTTNRNGTPRTNGQVVPLIKGSKQADDRAETERLRKKFPGAFDDQ